VSNLHRVYVPTFIFVIMIFFLIKSLVKLLMFKIIRYFECIII